MAPSILNSCGAVVKSKANKYLTEEQGAIPPEFGKENTTLIFIKHRNSYNKYLKKNSGKIYQGAYELVSEKEFKSKSKYKDISKYRYVFDYSAVSPGYTAVRGDGSMRSPLYDVKKC